MKKIFLIYLIFIISDFSYSQNNTVETAFWKLTSLNGEFNINGSYWDQKTNRDNFNENLKSSFLSGGLFLNSQSYFYHPNFMGVEFNVGFNPETGQRLSLVAPDQSEVNSLKKLYTKITFFQKSKINFNTFISLNEGYSNRENLTNLKTNFENWGGTLVYQNKFVPFNVSYSQTNNAQLELQTDRFYKTDNTNISARADKSFGLRDQNQFTFSHNKYVYNEQFPLSNQVQTGRLLKNNITLWKLTDNVYFDSKRNFNLYSLVSNEIQDGNFIFQRFQVLENISGKLPWHLNFNSSYNYFDNKQDVITSKQHFARASLTHLLYESVTTNTLFQYNTIKSSQYALTNKRAGLNIKYVKKVPLNGLLNLSYGIRTQEENRSSEDASLTILNEEHVLSDSQMTLLNNQNINLESVLVKDVTGTIIYNLNFDYVLITRNKLLEIQRIPGGNIPNESAVLIDYSSLQPSSYEFKAINKIFSANLSLFKNKITFYYNNSKQDFVDPVNIENLTLDFFDQNVYGSRFNFGFISGGIEQDNYKSTLIPYRLTRYFLELQGSFKNKILLSLNGDIRDYQMIVEEGTTQQFFNISGNIGYNISQNTKLNWTSSYRDENISNYELKVLVSKLEMTTQINQIFITTGFEFYNNKLKNENLNFKKGTIRISRKF